MTQIPDQSSGWPAGMGEPASGRRVKTSGMAIASLICGVLSVAACCTFLPGILAVTFGAVALPAIRRQEAGGFGLAVSGITLGVLGLIVGGVGWALIAASPDITPIPGRELRTADRALLEELNVIRPEESIEFFYSDGMFSIREGGVVLTADRVATYDETGAGQSLPFADVKVISFTPGSNCLEYGDFILEADDGRLLIFRVGAWDEGDQLFHRTFRQLVAEAREAAAKPPVRSQLSSEVADPEPE